MRIDMEYDYNGPDRWSLASVHYACNEISLCGGWFSDFRY